MREFDHCFIVLHSSATLTDLQHSQVLTKGMTRLTPLILIGLTLTVCFFTITGPKNVFQLLKLHREIAELKAANSRIESEIEQVGYDVDVATRDQFFLEKRAREELALSKHGEIVYIFTDK